MSGIKGTYSNYSKVIESIIDDMKDLKSYNKIRVKEFDVNNIKIIINKEYKELFVK